MDPQTIFLPAKPRVGRKRKDVPHALPAPAGPVLVGASYYAETLVLVLEFDRAVSFDVVSPNEISVRDGEAGLLVMNTTSVEAAGPTTLLVQMIEDSEWAGPGVTLSATAMTSIVAADDGAPWSGAADVALPFP